MTLHVSSLLTAVRKFRAGRHLLPLCLIALVLSAVSHPAAANVYYSNVTLTPSPSSCTSKAGVQILCSTVAVNASLGTPDGINSITFSDPANFSAVSNTCGGNNSNNCSITVDFLANKAGSYSTTMSVEYYVWTGNDFIGQTTLSATVTPVAVPEPAVAAFLLLAAAALVGLRKQRASA